jgi:DNA invertase Pin-like site-specific DNA recombinase
MTRQTVVQRLVAYKNKGPKPLSYSELARQLKTSQQNVYRWIVNQKTPHSYHVQLIENFLNKNGAKS